jgi:hypothetical protein
MAEHWVKTGDTAKRQGPFSGRQLKQLAQSGQLQPEHLVSSDDGVSWNLASRFSGLEFVSLLLESEEPPPEVGPPSLAAPEDITSEPHAPQDATTILVLGILGLLVCFPLGPVAWLKGHSYRRQCRELGVEPEGKAVAGWICGIIGSVLLIIGLVVPLVFFVLIWFAGTPAAPFIYGA